jgi:DNA-binding transcriptional ArsR family regulator
VLVVEDRRQLRALADGLRSRIVFLLRERAASTTELAAVLGMPKGTVGHHLKVLERAGLVRVVRTRKVRALTARYYGRVARVFVLKGDESASGDLRGGALSAMMLRQAADELLAAADDERGVSGLMSIPIKPADQKRFERRVKRLVADFQRARDPVGEPYALAYALYPAPRQLPGKSEGA